MDNAKYQEYINGEKWRSIAAERMKIDAYKCVMCGSRGTTLNPLEVHHLRYRDVLYHEDEGNNIYTQLCTLCHACHKQIHAVMNRQTDPNGRRGWKDNCNVPAISVYTIAGESIESKEVGKL